MTEKCVTTPGNAFRNFFHDNSASAILLPMIYAFAIEPYRSHSEKYGNRRFRVDRNQGRAVGASRIW
jgi:hypothetical protein